MRLTKVKKELTPSQAPGGALRTEWAEVGERPDLCVPPSAESHCHERMESLTDGGGPPDAPGRRRLHQVQEIIEQPQVCTVSFVEAAQTVPEDERQMLTQICHGFTSETCRPSHLCSSEVGVGREKTDLTAAGQV